MVDVSCCACLPMDPIRTLPSGTASGSGRDGASAVPVPAARAPTPLTERTEPAGMCTGRGFLTLPDTELTIHRTRNQTEH